ncbi:MAG: DUF4230 domain-containing protein [Bdellovibrionales bacterium]|nr:DUF4230 domain-containing protein [Bdellovibrionales bacterium]
MKLSKTIFAFVFSVFLLGVGFYAGTYYAQGGRIFSQSDQLLKETIEDILTLGVVESQVSRIFQMKKDKLTLYSIGVPFTEQKSMILVKGNLQFGYDLHRLQIEIDPIRKRIEIRNAKVVITSSDFEFEYLFEEDSIFRPITPQDRNQMLAEIRPEMLKGLPSKSYEDRVAQKTRELLTKLQVFTPWTIEIIS